MLRIPVPGSIFVFFKRITSAPKPDFRFRTVKKDWRLETAYKAYGAFKTIKTIIKPSRAEQSALSKTALPGIRCFIEAFIGMRTFCSVPIIFSIFGRRSKTRYVAASFGIFLITPSNRPKRDTFSAAFR